MPRSQTPQRRALVVIAEDQRCERLSTTDAHRDNRVFKVTTMEVKGSAQREDRASRSHGVSECDRTSVRIDFLWVEARVADNRYRLGCEGFVHFEHVDIRGREPGVLPQALERDDGRISHKLGFDRGG